MNHMLDFLKTLSLVTTLTIWTIVVLIYVGCVWIIVKVMNFVDGSLKE